MITGLLYLLLAFVDIVLTVRYDYFLREMTILKITIFYILFYFYCGKCTQKNILLQWR